MKNLFRGPIGGGLLTIAIGLLFGFVFSLGIDNLNAQTEANQKQFFTQFDHSNCQYPERWSNPVDGCDNSDPAVPECIKWANTQENENTCIAEFVAQHNQPTQSEPLPTTKASEQNTCSGGVK